MAAFFILGAVTAGLGAAVPRLSARYDLAPGEAGIAVSAYNVGALVAIVTAGLLVRRSPSAATVVQITAVLGCAGMSQAPSWPMFLLAAATAGIGYGGLVLYLNTAFPTAFGEHGVLMLNLLNAAFGAGAVAGPLIVGATGLHLFAGAAIALIPCVAVRATGRPMDVASESHGEQPDAAGWSHIGPLLPFATIAFLYAGIETGTGTWEASHLVGLGHSDHRAAQYTALFWCGLACGRVVIPLLFRKASPGALMTGCLAAATAALVAASVGWAAPAAYALTGLFAGPVFPTLMAWQSHARPDTTAGPAGSLIATMVGSMVFPAAIGQVIGWSSSQAVPFVLVGIGAITLAVVLAARTGTGTQQQLYGTHSRLRGPAAGHRR